MARVDHRHGNEAHGPALDVLVPEALEPCSRVFVPVAAEIVVVDGRMIENLHVDNVRGMLALAAR